LNLVGAGVSAVAGVLLVVVVTRALPQRDAGVFFALTSVFLLAEMVARLGTGTGLVYFIARLRRLGRTDRIRAYQRVALTPVVALSLATCAVLVVWAPDFARLVGGPTDATRAAVVVLALLLPVTTLSDTLLAATRGHATMVPTVALDRVGRPVLQLGLVAIAVTGGSTAVLAGAWALPWAVSAALAWWWLLRLGRQLHAGRHSAENARPGSADEAAPWREFWAFTAPRAVNSLAQLALQRLDIILVTVLIGPAQGAVYTAATRFLVVGQLTATAISTAAQPRLAEQLAVHDRASAKAVYQSATAWIVLLNWPLYLLCAVFADVVLAVFGEGYDAGRPVVLVLAGAMLVASACGMVDMLLNMAGRTSWTLANSVVALVVMVSVDLLLIPRLGVLGAGIGWAAAIVANNALPLTQLVVSMGLHPFGRATLRAAALSAACFGVLPGLAVLLLPGGLLSAAAAVLLGGAVFLTVVIRWREALGVPALSTLRPPRRRPSPETDDAPHARHAAPSTGGDR
ncbi:MAG: multi antimicrobial extrusion protein MatE, partial [Blastococcus sp.]|nr:multi antimicrobial extrusion protein MatE [Blastococcus sp.]